MTVELTQPLSSPSPVISVRYVAAHQPRLVAVMPATSRSVSAMSPSAKNGALTRQPAGTYRLGCSRARPGCLPGGPPRLAGVRAGTECPEPDVGCKAPSVPGADLDQATCRRGRAGQGGRGYPQPQLDAEFPELGPAAPRATPGVGAWPGTALAVSAIVTRVPGKDAWLSPAAQSHRPALGSAPAPRSPGRGGRHGNAPGRGRHQLPGLAGEGIGRAGGQYQVIGSPPLPEASLTRRPSTETAVPPMPCWRIGGAGREGRPL